MDLAYVSCIGSVAIFNYRRCWKYANILRNRLDFPLGSYPGPRDALLSSQDRPRRHMEAIERGKHYALQCLSDCEQDALSPSRRNKTPEARSRYCGGKSAYTTSFRDDDKFQS